jgi:hypothetical protein
MAREEEINRVMHEALHISTDILIGELIWPESPPHSRRVQAARALNNLVGLNQLERGKTGKGSFFRIKECRSEWQPHSELISSVIVDLLRNFHAAVRREISVPAINRRADCIALLQNKSNTQYLCIILECLVNESESSLQAKERDWLHFDGALGFLSDLFKAKVRSFGVVGIKPGQNIISLLPKE